MKNSTITTILMLSTVYGCSNSTFTTQADGVGGANSNDNTRFSDSTGGTINSGGLPSSGGSLNTGGSRAVGGTGGNNTGGTLGIGGQPACESELEHRGDIWDRNWGPVQIVLYGHDNEVVDSHFTKNTEQVCTWKCLQAIDDFEMTSNPCETNHSPLICATNVVPEHESCVMIDEELLEREHPESFWCCNDDYSTKYIGL